MKPPPFEYHVPESLEHALELLRDNGDEARPLAGGQSLVPMLNFRLARPSVLIDLNFLPGLGDITAGEGEVHFGTMVRERAAERSSIVHQRSPLLAAALPLVGHEAIRTRGTLGGSMAHADPAAELPAVAVAAGAQLVLRSADRGERVVDADDFFQGYFTTTIEPDELLVEIRLPELQPGTGVRFEEVARRHGDFAMVGVLAALHIHDGVVDDARLALIGVADRAVRARQAEALLVGAKPDGGVFGEAAATAVRDLEPMSDLHGSSAYRKHVAERLVRRALNGAASVAGAQ
jgi:aerobic carbon-monoxide dehydrogenase medium subunit